MTATRTRSRRQAVVMTADRNLFRMRTVVKLFSDALTFMASGDKRGGASVHLSTASSHLLAAGHEITFAITARDAGEPIPTMLPGEYLARCRRAAGLTIADVAAAVATVPRLGEIDRQDLVRAVEADARAATIHTLAALRAVFPFSIEEVSRLIDLQDAGPADFAATEHVSC